MRETLDFRGDLERGVLCGEGGERCGVGLGAKGGETFNGEDLLVEDETELAGGLMGYGFETGQGLGWVCAAAASRARISFLRLVTGRLVMPQGLMRAKSRRSVVTLKAKPWEVMPRETWMPMAPILRSPRGGLCPWRHRFRPKGCRAEGTRRR